MLRFDGLLTPVSLGMVASIVAHVGAQVTPTVDSRELRVTAESGVETDGRGSVPSPAFAGFADSIAAHLRTCCVALDALSTQESSVSATRMEAIGAASAGGASGATGFGFAQSASTFFITFRVVTPQSFHYAGVLRAGTVFTARAFLRKSDGSLNHDFDSAQVSGFDVSGTLAPGTYFVGAFANVNVGLFADQAITDATDYAVMLDLADVVCAGDFNLDGTLDFFDFSDFVECFEGGACPPGTDPDFNDDGTQDIFDYDDFLAAFEGGC